MKIDNQTIRQQNTQNCTNMLIENVKGKWQQNFLLFHLKETLN